MARFTAQKIHEMVKLSYSPGNFQSLVLEILADMMEILEQLERRKYE